MFYFAWTLQYDFMKLIAYIIILLISINTAQAQSKHQIRAVWLTTAYGLDWPKENAKNQKKELAKILDTLSDLNINMVMFQCRIRGDVVYESEFEPYNDIIRKAGIDFDPLAFVIDECHKRGIECHAWIVCLPLGKATKLSSQTWKYIENTGDNLIMKSGKQIFLDPAKAGTRKYLEKISSEIVSNYDIDGLHLDYIRYPDDYKAFPKTRKLNKQQKASIRRDDITKIVRAIYTNVKKIKPWVTVSCATIGKYRTTSRINSLGWEAYNGVGQDVERWIKEGIVDVVFPMMYFKDSHFYPFADDWKEIADGMDIVPVLGLYQIEYDQSDWDADEITRQIQFCNWLGMDGIGLYRTETLIDNTKNISSWLRNNTFNTKALPRKGNKAHNEINGSRVEITGYDETNKLHHIKWRYTGNNRDDVTFTVYASNSFPVDINDPSNLIETGITADDYYYGYVYEYDNLKYFAITATDKYGNESEAATIQIGQDLSKKTKPSIILR